MSVSNSIERMRRGILKQLQVEYDHLHPGAQRHVGKAVSHTRKYIERFDSGVQEKGPKGREHIKHLLVGRADSIAAALDGGKRSPPSKQGDKKRKVVVGKK